MKVADIKVHLVQSQRKTDIPSPWIFVEVLPRWPAGGMRSPRGERVYRHQGVLPRWPATTGGAD